MPIGPWIIPAISGGLGLLSSLFKQKPQEYRETPLQRYMGTYMQNLLRQGGTGMSPELFSQFQQAYAVPQQTQWAMNLLPQIFGGMNFPGQQTMPQGQFPQMQFNPFLGMGQMSPFMGQAGGMGQQWGGWGGQGGGGYGVNPFAMMF